MIDLTRHQKSLSTITIPDLNQFMTTQEAARMLGFTEVSVRSIVYKKKLASIRFGQSMIIPKNQ